MLRNTDWPISRMINIIKTKKKSKKRVAAYQQTLLIRNSYLSGAVGFVCGTSCPPASRGSYPALCRIAECASYGIKISKPYRRV